MPEIAEVARIVHYLRKSLVGKTLSVVKAQDDTNVFGKVGTSGAEFQKSLIGKKVLDAGQQGKYFWLIMSSPPHPVLHFGMTGWFYIRGEPSIHYRPKDSDDAEAWPPKFWKFSLETKEEPKVEAAFTDARRFGRVRLVDCAAEDIRNTTPLKENGPDPVIDKHILTEEWLEQKMRSKHVPVKALLLDQANVSGIGNWVGDEVLYHAKLHPEQYSDTFSSAQLKQLHKSIMHVCQTAVDALGDSSKFPDEWLFNHRWGKGKKDAPTTLPNGAKITFLKVGGRTSCVVPTVQKKTGAVAGDLKTEEKNGVLSEETKSTGKTSKKRKAVEEDDAENVKVEPTISKKGNGKGRGKKSDVANDDAVEAEEVPNGQAKKRKATSASESASAKPSTTESAEKDSNSTAGRRRSGRVSQN